MKKSIYLAAAAVAALFAGCASVQVADDSALNDQKIATEGKSIAHINGQNWGFYFLSYPIAAGSVNSVGMTSWFGEDSVNVPSVVKMVTAKAKEMGASRVVDLSSQRGGTMIPIPFPFLFYMNDVNVSGNAIK
ncbi:MAG: hypothetical protein PHI85_00810 [Victivallaceae bacterium]|nr:hypothetical protein [Victivallaceae bacterium]